MRLRAFLVAVSIVLGSASLRAQMMEQSADSQAATQKEASADAAMTDPAQKKAAQTFAGKSRVAPPKPAVQTPLTPRERAVQLLNRFTFGPRPGDVDRVLAMGPGASGIDKWLAQQMEPGSIRDTAVDRRMNDWPTVSMTPAQALITFPERGYISQVAEGKVPPPGDPLLAAEYEVLVYKWRAEQQSKDPATAKAQPTDAEAAQQKAEAQAIASRIAGELFALPKNKRMSALIAMPVPDRIAFAANVTGDQKSMLLADFTPRERETFVAMAGGTFAAGNLVTELAQARITRDVLTERQLQEVMTDFWFNHFNIFAEKDADRWYTATYEREVIRKNALGNFKDLLLATAQSPAMMVYLDNWLSIGANSAANGVNPKNPNAKKGAKGLNENYGREVMELHTVGVNGGYTQADVTALSAVLTGWGVAQPYKGGAFLFDQKKHEPGDKQWLGHTIHEGRNADGSLNGMAEGLEALNILASSPQTAHFISWKLAQRFVADNPPPAFVDRLAKVFLSSDGDIKTVLRALIASPEFNSRQYFRNKVKTPVEFVASAFRATSTEPQNPAALVNVMRQMGMPLYQALPPTGYYITANQWMNSVALVDRLNFAYQLTNNKFANQKFDAPKLLAIGLLMPPVAPATVSLVKPVSGAGPSRASARMLGVSSATPERDVPQTSAAGTDIALRVLESTMIGSSVSPQTNQLIHKQLEQQPVSASATDTLNLLTALVMGSPEFQMR